MLQTAKAAAQSSDEQLLFEEAKRLVAALDFNRDDGPASSTG
jgi:hypothetical protein